MPTGRISGLDPPPPWRLQRFAELGSTQTLCRERAEAGEPGHLAILADRQTSGQGTRGRIWSSPPGNLSLSILLRPGTRAATAGQWALLAAVALAECVAERLPAGPALRVKWPNDLLLDGGKLAGILTQSAGNPDGKLDWLVIGFGVNLASAPALSDRATACLAEHVPPPDPQDFAGRLLQRLTGWERQLAVGFHTVRDAWLGFAPPLGSSLSVRLPARTVHGNFAGLHADGRLLVAADGSTTAYAAGEL